MGWSRSIFCAQRLSHFWTAILRIREDRHHQLKAFLDQTRFQDLPSLLRSHRTDCLRGPGANSPVATSTPVGSHFPAKLFFTILAAHLVPGGRRAFLPLTAATFPDINANWQRQTQPVSCDSHHFFRPLLIVPLLADSGSPARPRLGPHCFPYPSSDGRTLRRGYSRLLCALRSGIVP